MKSAFIGMSLGLVGLFFLFILMPNLQKKFPILDPLSYEEIDSYNYDHIKRKLKEHPSLKKDIQDAYADGVITTREFLNLCDKMRKLEEPKERKKLIESKKELLENSYD